MDKRIKEYRKKHKKCKWCKYYKYESPSTKSPWISCPDYEKCTLKDKIIHFTNLRRFCKYYELKEEENEI